MNSLLGASGLRLSGDLSALASGLVLLLLAVTIWLLLAESRAAARLRGPIALSGLVAALLLALAVLRPAILSELTEPSLARVVVLVDGSERQRLPGRGEESRQTVVQRVLGELEQSLSSARLQVMSFGDGRELSPYEEDSRSPPRIESDFERAIATLESDPEGPPNAIIVVGDGRLTANGAPGLQGASAREASAKGDVASVGRGSGPVHTVRLLDEALRDKTLLNVAMPDSVVAHEPFRLDVEVGCFGGASCDNVSLHVVELLQGGLREERASAVPEVVADSRGERAKASLRLTLDRSGSRILEVSIEGDDADKVPENNRRFVEVNVRRDRLRLLHVAGRPTYDVRALRTFLKSDRSVDLVAFFILRTPTDHVMAPPSELALIPFPVDELFSEHLPSFDAIILQDIDAVEYGVAAHFRELRDYVKKGGGIVLVGGPSMFAAGGYADSPLAEVLPVSLRPTKRVADVMPFVPLYTRLGQKAPLLAGLRALLGERLPEVGGVNLVGPPERGSYVLWEHPTLAPVGGAQDERMPILAVREVGDGRSIVLGLDSTHRLRFGPEGMESAGRAHGSLWEGMLGWLMRDPRFELAQARAAGPCISGRPYRITVEPLGEAQETLELNLEPLGKAGAVEARRSLRAEALGSHFVFDLVGPEPGGYAALLSLGKAPPLRFVFGCEAGGAAWADSRPDAERLRNVSLARGGVSVTPADVSSIRAPEGSRIITKSVSVPLLPDVAWSSLAALALGVHWLIRRFGGLL